MTFRSAIRLMTVGLLVALNGFATVRAEDEIAPSGESEPFAACKQLIRTSDWNSVPSKR